MWSCVVVAANPGCSCTHARGCCAESGSTEAAAPSESAPGAINIACVTRPWRQQLLSVCLSVRLFVSLEKKMTSALLLCDFEKTGAVGVTFGSSAEKGDVGVTFVRFGEKDDDDDDDGCDD